MARIHQLLNGYDCWSLPHVGPPESLSEAQRAANLADILERKDTRIAYLRNRVAELNNPVASIVLESGDPTEAIGAIEAWWNAEMHRIDVVPPLPLMVRVLGSKRDHSSFRVRRDPDWHLRPQAAALTSLITDLALAFAEGAIRRRPDFTWAINEDSADRRRQLLEWGRPVVFRPARVGWAAVSLDFLARMRRAYERLLLNKDFGRPYWPPVSGQDFAGWDLAHLVAGRMTMDRFDPATGAYIKFDVAP